MQNTVFLSSEWFALLYELYEAHNAVIPEKFIGQSINFIVKDTPRGVSTFSISDGHYFTEHQDKPKATVSLDYQMAYTVLIKQDMAAGMMAMMSGKLKVEGNLASVLLLKQAQDVPEFKIISEIVKEKTIAI